MDTPALLAILTEAQDFGFIGPGPVEDQLARSLAFTQVLQVPLSGLAVDLGTGGGLPGLVLALAWPASHWVFVEANRRRCTWLESSLSSLGLGSRVSVMCDRAEVVGRGPHRHRASLVTARSFALPAATAECGAPFLAPGALMIVTDPPGNDPATIEGRWPSAGLQLLGLRFKERQVVATEGGPVTLALLERTGPCPDIYPRRVGVPEKRPLFT